MTDKLAELQGVLWRVQQASNELSPWAIQDTNNLWETLLLVSSNVATAISLLEEWEKESMKLSQ
ncbi:MAG TPA: hypothetical protein IAA27_04590 [Candidatus Enterococcus stercoravium]|nr:hypothetical protein [Candidatus Enterococcus stercoravium]